MTIRDSILKVGNEKIYLKYYYTDDVYEEMVSNLPNDLLLDIDGVPENNQLIALMDYVYSAWRRDNVNDVEFPFAFHFSVINKWVMEKDKIFSQKFNEDNIEHLSYRPFF